MAIILFLPVLLSLILALLGYTTLAIFIAGVEAIGLISRYNESNKLFWALFVSFVLGFAGTKMIVDTFDDKERSDNTLIQTSPIQGLDAASDTCLCLLAGELLSTDVKVTSKPVGQASASEYYECGTTSSDAVGVTQGLYLHALPNPPNSVIMFDTS